MGPVKEDNIIRVVEQPWDYRDVLSDLTKGGEEGPFYMMDIGEVVRTYSRWKELMPRVKPFYAVKCNPDKFLVSTLAALGTGFDCASRGEIEIVTALEVPPERIIFANPAKLPSHIEYAERMGVLTSTFDNAHELIKMKKLSPRSKLVLRIRCDAVDAMYQLGEKFGCDPVTESPGLLRKAADLGLEVIGIAFHIGSNGRDFTAYNRAVRYSRTLFDIGSREGHSMRLLDIGGGFPSSRDADLVKLAAIINEALAEHFPDEAVEVISEPGRYFACSSYTLAAMVFGKREKIVECPDGEATRHTMYFISDGVYGSFNCILANEEVTTETLKPMPGIAVPSSVWGPSGDVLDCVIPSILLPPLSIGDWLVFRDRGSYSIAIATTFNGFPHPHVKAIVDKKLWPVLSKLHPLSEMQFVPHKMKGADTEHGATLRDNLRNIATNS